MYPLAVLALLASSAAGFLVAHPNQRQGWSNNGAQVVTWERVSTDPEIFAILLTNVNRDLLPIDIVLARSVDATGDSSLSIDPPTGGWPTPGGSYRINLVRSDRELNTIYAQSNEFNITAANDHEAESTTARSSHSDSLGVHAATRSAARNSGSSTVGVAGAPTPQAGADDAFDVDPNMSSPFSGSTGHKAFMPSLIGIALMLAYALF
ncbi:hypothetical protein FA15DRAFT_488165 [Coprinopsis marcescibilis]|uniref:Yeast cell wall synthesis Kre9/Knh1-like N-terminal domain-containing protein n=1 Tax=Coprinopsis marcescibilis TaxID=230819 RepID=A0A5C3L877_COPMA|nr:hypothetical protein FA15DRAFT_488165 [Coprinopsis marcescibilis]